MIKKLVMAFIYYKTHTYTHIHPFNLHSKMSNCASVFQFSNLFLIKVPSTAQICTEIKVENRNFIHRIFHLNFYCCFTEKFLILILNFGSRTSFGIFICIWNSFKKQRDNFIIFVKFLYLGIQHVYHTNIYKYWKI